jgi:hypothetical protein
MFLINLHKTVRIQKRCKLPKFILTQPQTQQQFIYPMPFPITKNLQSHRNLRHRHCPSLYACQFHYLNASCSYFLELTYRKLQALINIPTQTPKKQHTKNKKTRTLHPTPPQKNHPFQKPTKTIWTCRLLCKLHITPLNKGGL